MKASTPDDGDDAARADLEAKYTRSLTRALRAQLRTLLPADGGEADVRAAITRLPSTMQPLRDAVLKLLLDGALLGTQAGRRHVETLLGTVKADPSISLVDWTLVDEDARQWARSYSFTLASGIQQTTTTVLQNALSEYIGNTLTYKDLLAQLAPTFGKQRADLIATTEITRAFAEGNRAAWQKAGTFQMFEWRTANDERTCPYCLPLNGQQFAMNAEMPPAHPRCRCWVVPVVETPKNG